MSSRDKNSSKYYLKLCWPSNYRAKYEQSLFERFTFLLHMLQCSAYTILFSLIVLSVISIITAEHCPQCKLFAKSLKRCNLNEDRELMAMEILMAQARPGGTSAGAVMSMSISRRRLWSKLFLHSNRKHKWGHTFLQHR